MVDREKLNRDFDQENITNLKATIQKSLLRERTRDMQKSAYVPEKSLFKTRVIEPLFLAT